MSDDLKEKVIAAQERVNRAARELVRRWRRDGATADTESNLINALERLDASELHQVIPGTLRCIRCVHAPFATNADLMAHLNAEHPDWMKMSPLVGDAVSLGEGAVPERRDVASERTAEAQPATASAEHADTSSSAKPEPSPVSTSGACEYTKEAGR